MKKIIMQILTLTIAFCFVASASAQPIAERSLPYSEYWPGMKHQVTINISGPDGAIHIEETPPMDWTIDDVENNGKVNNGVITWDLDSQDNQSAIITYSVTPPSTAEGNAVFSGKIGDHKITEIITLSQASQSPQPLGIFQDHKDIVGEIRLAYDAAYDSQTGEYQIRAGSSPDFWSHLVYSELSGPFLIQARLKAECPSTDIAGAAIIIITDELILPPPAFYMVFYRTNGQVKGEWRISNNHYPDVTGWITPSMQDGWIRLEREGKLARMYYYNIQTQEWILYDTQEIELNDPVYAALAAWSNENHEMAVGHFWDVELKSLLETSSLSNWQLY